MRIFRFNKTTKKRSRRCLKERKKVLTCEKSSLPTGFFLYRNMAADSLFCTQIWLPWRHVKTICTVRTPGTGYYYIVFWIIWELKIRQIKQKLCNVKCERETCTRNGVIAAALPYIKPGVTSSRAVVTVFAQFIVHGGKNKRFLGLNKINSLESLFNLHGLSKQAAYKCARSPENRELASLAGNEPKGLGHI